MSSAVCLPAMCKSSLFLRLSSLSSSIEDRLPSKGVFHQRLSSIEGHLPLKVIFHQRLSSIKGCLPLKVVFHQRSSSIEGRLPSKVIFHRRSSSIQGRLRLACCPRASPEVNQANKKNKNALTK